MRQLQQHQDTRGIIVGPGVIALGVVVSAQENEGQAGALSGNFGDEIL